MNLRRENHENPCTNRANRDRHWRRSEEEEKATHLDLQVEGSLFLSFPPEKRGREKRVVVAVVLLVAAASVVFSLVLKREKAVRLIFFSSGLFFLSHLF